MNAPRSLRVALPLALSCLGTGSALAQVPVVKVGKFLTPDTTLAKVLSGVQVQGGTGLVSYLDADDVGADAGAVYAIERQPGGQWVQTGKLLPSSGAGLSEFGHAVSVDGPYAVVSDPIAATIWLFQKSGSAWNQVGPAVAPPWSFPGGQQGTALAISGSTVIVGAPQYFGLGPLTGAIYFYQATPAGLQYVSGPTYAGDFAAGARYGNAIAMDGDRAMIAAMGQHAVYFFEKTVGWQQKTKITKSILLSDEFASCVAISGDWAAAGAFEDGTAAQSAGAVYLFHRDAAGTWSDAQKIYAADANGGDQFGISLDLAGGRLLVGARGDSQVKASAGAAYVFELGPSGTWTQRAKLIDPAGSIDDNLGYRVALGADGTILATSPEDDDVASDLGTVHLWDAESLSAGTSSISLAAGGTQALGLAAGLAQAGRFYLLAGSVSGTSPGLPLGPSLVVPLNYDAYTAYTLSAPNQPPLSGSAGVLGAAGGGLASFTLPPNSDPGLAGTTVNHAFVVLNLAAGAAVVFASNASGVQLVP